MVHPMVERATSDLLIGPDWAKNMEICDVCNQDPMQAKEIVRGIKKRLRSNQAKVQLLTLALLETIIKNCGDIIHMHVADKDIPHKMVNIVKKKPDFQVKEKIMFLIDSWQEAFGGPRGRYPQYYAAYQELLRTGASFPRRSEKTAPIFTPPQTQPLTSNPHNMRGNDEEKKESGETSESEYPQLSLTELQNARSIMDVLAEMLNALDPKNKEGVRQEVIVDLVEQCRTYKQRVVHLVNSTSDESLLCQGLALNDDLQRLLAKHEAISSGNTTETENLKHKSDGPLIDVDDPLVDTNDKSIQQNKGSREGAQPLNQLSLHTPSASSPMADLLSGEENSLALVPVEQTQPSSPKPSQNNALVVFDMFGNENNSPKAINTPPTHLSVRTGSPQNGENVAHPNGFSPQMGSPPSISVQVNCPIWNGQLTPQQQPGSPAYGYSPAVHANGSLPPPPWEAQQSDGSPIAGGSPMAGNQYSQAMQITVVTQMQPLPNGMHHHVPQIVRNDQGMGTYYQQPPGYHPQAREGGGQYIGMIPQHGQVPTMTYPQQMYENQMGGYGYGYGYSQQQETYLDQQMHGLSIRDDSVLTDSSNQAPIAQSLRPPKPEDKLFGDLVDYAKIKPSKSTSGRADTM